MKQMKQIQVADELGRRWVIYEADPAWDHCRLLTKVGVRQIVLPWQTLLTGNKPSQLPPLTPLVQAVQQCTEVLDAIRRRIRLRDCIAFLEG